MADALQRAIDTYQKRRLRLLALGDELGDEAAKLLHEYAQAIVRFVAQDTFPAGEAIRTEAQLTTILRRIDQELERMLDAQGIAFADGTERIMQQQFRDTFEAYGFLGKSTVGRLRAVAEVFNFQPIADDGFAMWDEEFRAVGNDLRNKIHRQAVNSQLLGQSQRDFAKSIEQLEEFQFKNLPDLSGRGMNILTHGGEFEPSEALKFRARRIARDINTNVQNLMHIRWCEEAFENPAYVNLNPLDQRTTSGCAEASAEEAKSLSEWLAWEGTDGQRGLPGPPPLGGRKPNCRSTPFCVSDRSEDGVPEGVEIKETTRKGQTRFEPVEVNA